MTVKKRKPRPRALMFSTHGARTTHRKRNELRVHATSTPTDSCTSESIVVYIHLTGTHTKYYSSYHKYPVVAEFYSYDRKPREGRKKENEGRKTLCERRR